MTVHDWNPAPAFGEGAPEQNSSRPDLFDDTLRDGLQNASVREPDLDGKAQLLGEMAQLGVGFAGIGMPSTSRRHFDECVALCQIALDSKLRVIPVCAARTLEEDVRVALQLCQKVGQRIELHVFLATSQIRSLAEQWSAELLQRRTASSVRMAVRGGVEVAFVAEDASRSRPDTLAQLFGTAIDEGAHRICLCDTVGVATPAGVRRLVRFTKEVIAKHNQKVLLDWHGHNDRGLALANTLEAWAGGANRLHGTALGIGERVGNTPLELLVLNLHLAGVLPLGDASHIVRYGERAAALLGHSIPSNYPLLGGDAFRTATGVHASAIRKAECRGDTWLAERVYSAFAASSFGREQEICVGHVSGSSNVTHWLERHGYPADDALVGRILAVAKSGRGLLSEQTLHELASTTTSDSV